MAPTEVVDNLYVADIQDVQTLDLDNYGIDVVVGVCQDSAEDNVGCDYHYFCLSDGEPEGHCPGVFDYELFEEAVDVTRSFLDEGKNVLVHCHMGQSRSVSVVAVTMVYHCEYNLMDAYYEISQHRMTHPSQELVSLAKEYVERNGV